MVNRSQPAHGAGEFELLTAAQVASITGISATTLHAYAARREAGLGPVLGPTHVALGPRRRRWLRKDVLAWIESCRVTGPRSVQAAADPRPRGGSGKRA